MSRPVVAVLDYGSGNVHSAVKALIEAGADARLTSDRSLLLDADGLLVPGVGAFSAVMGALNASRGGEIIDRRLAGGRQRPLVEHDRLQVALPGWPDRQRGGEPVGSDPAGS